MKESDLIKTYMIKFSDQGDRLFRINSGQAWTGNTIKRINPKTILIEGARPFRTGVPVGFPDTIGWIRRDITPEMVGQVIAQFTGIEFKAGKTRVTTAQQNFIDLLNNVGAYGEIIRG